LWLKRPPRLPLLKTSRIEVVQFAYIDESREMLGVTSKLR
jgi:hypothetical protein